VKFTGLLSSIFIMLSSVHHSMRNRSIMQLYAPSEDNAFKSKEDITAMMNAVAGIAGCAGVSNLVLELLKIGLDYPIDFDDKMDVLAVILEAARKRAPVNNVNVVTTEAQKLTVHKKVRKLPKGTVLAGSIGLACLDPAVFENPTKFDHKRKNLIKASLNFNSVGFSAEGSGTRQCPGRNVAVVLATDLLKTRLELGTEDNFVENH